MAANLRIENKKPSSIKIPAGVYNVRTPLRGPKNITNDQVDTTIYPALIT